MKSLLPLILSLSAPLIPAVCHAEEKRIVLIAGKPSHGPGEHEHRAGMLLFQKCLRGVPGVRSDVITGGWPDSPALLDGAAAVILYCDGGPNHPAVQEGRLAQLDSLIRKGTGFGCIHYACEPTQAKGQSEFLRWIGGCFEIHHSVNPTWTAIFDKLPEHPLTRGVHPFSLHDEWYFHMRFATGSPAVTAILSTVPPASTMSRPDGPHEGNPDVRAAIARGEAQTMVWACERPDGGRGFGFTGGHYHQNWGDPNFRKLALNAILWSAKAEVPAQGVESTVSADDLRENLDPKAKH